MKENESTALHFTDRHLKRFHWPTQEMRIHVPWEFFNRSHWIHYNHSNNSNQIKLSIAQIKRKLTFLLVTKWNSLINITKKFVAQSQVTFASITIIAFNLYCPIANDSEESRHKEKETKQFKQIKHSTNSQFELGNKSQTHN